MDERRVRSVIRPRLELIERGVQMIMELLNNGQGEFNPEGGKRHFLRVPTIQISQKHVGC